MIKHENIVVGVIGLGYVGLPLALAFGEKTKTIAYDIDRNRICELKDGVDSTSEVLKENFLLAKYIEFTSDEKMLSDVNFYIVTVPTPIDEFKKPDLNLLEAASKTIAKYLQPGDIVVYESTVYPGLTEEFCLPILEEISNLRCQNEIEGLSDGNRGDFFYLGYSPERINPGDQSRDLRDIVKVVSGSNDFSLNKVAYVYSLIIRAGIHLAPSIKVAEAAKVIENTQRDLNIAFFNELSIIFEKLGISTHDVIAAAKTKWNFLSLEPGLVGGHCIGVDPYYLAKKTQDLGLEPKVILAGRSVNESMVSHVVDRIKLTIDNGGILLYPNQPVKVLVLGLSFKENVSDIRNSKSIELFLKLLDSGYDVYAHDPHINKDDLPLLIQDKFLDDLIGAGIFDVVLISVPHKFYKANLSSVLSLIDQTRKTILFDLRAIFRGSNKVFNNNLTYFTL